MLRKLLAPLALAPTLLLTGCGPTFFSATGHVTSAGGPLDAWSQTPIGCSRDVFDGDTSQLVTFSFANPNANDPNREINDRRRPAFPIRMHLEQPAGGPGYKLTVENSRAGEAVLTSANCPSLAFSSKEGHQQFAEAHKSLSGSLTFDCTVNGNHLTSDLHFKHCE